METLFFIFLIVEVIMSIVAFIFYGADKNKAQKGKWRISEKTLLLCAFFMGSLGAFLGMRVFRHKTQHKQFVILVPVFLVVNLGVIVWSLVA